MLNQEKGCDKILCGLLQLNSIDRGGSVGGRNVLESPGGGVKCQIPLFQGGRY